VIFIKNIVQIFGAKARIKLNPKKIYEANNAGAVREMLKIASMLNQAMRVS